MVLGKQIQGGTWVFTYGAITLYGGTFQNTPADPVLCNSSRPLQKSPTCSHNPGNASAATFHTLPVWAIPRSLAATEGVALAFFSSGYLDGSIPPVRPNPPIDSGVGDLV